MITTHLRFLRGFRDQLFVSSISFRFYALIDHIRTGLTLHLVANLCRFLRFAVSLEDLDKSNTVEQVISPRWLVIVCVQHWPSKSQTLTSPSKLELISPLNKGPWSFSGEIKDKSVSVPLCPNSRNKPVFAIKSQSMMVPSLPPAAIGVEGAPLWTQFAWGHVYLSFETDNILTLRYPFHRSD